MIEHDHRPGPGPAFVFLHGLGGNAALWAAQLDELTEFNRTAWTMPGYGTSSVPDEYSFPALARSVVELLEYLELDRAILVGHSLGGMIAQQVAFDYPERVAGLVLAATTSVFGKPGSTFNDEFLASRLRPIEAGHQPADFAADLVDRIVAPSAPDELRNTATQAMAAITAAAYEATIRLLTTWDGRERLETITCPTRCVTGELDVTAPPRAVERLANAIPRAKFTAIPDAGHLCFAEKPDAFNTVVRKAAR